MTKHEFAEKWCYEDRQHYNELMADLNQLKNYTEKRGTITNVKNGIVHEWAPTTNLRWKHDYKQEKTLEQEWQCSNGESKWQAINVVY
jgi:hypothetical protein